MDLVQSILMGITQGLSEFLPISSSAHLVFTSNFYKVFKGVEIINENNQEIFLDIMLHFGTLIAVIIFFRRDILNIIKAIFDAIRTKKYSSTDFKIGLYIIIGTILTIIIAFPLYPIAQKLVFRPDIVGIILVITGFILLFSEYLSKKCIDKKEITLASSVLVGLVQGLASFPGFSRSGLTIAAGLMCGNDRLSAARYSFLLSIPIILGASIVYPFVTVDISELINYDWYSIIIGTLVSGVVGYLCIKYFMKFLSKFSLKLFGYYCIIMGIIAAVFFSIN